MLPKLRNLKFVIVPTSQAYICVSHARASSLQAGIEYLKHVRKHVFVEKTLEYVL